MPTISKTAREIPASAIRKLTPYADAAKAAGVKVYHLNIGAPDIKSPQSAVDAIHNFDFDHIPYTNSAGELDLRESLAYDYYGKLGIKFTPDEILVTVAGSEAIDIIIQAVCDPGDNILVIEPYYTNYYSFAFRNNVELKGIHTDIRTGFSVPSIDEFEDALTDRTRAILICNPNNPTGTLYPEKDLLSIGKFCKRHNLFLISDEVYREFCYTDEPHFSIMNIPGIEQSAILVDSVSKRYNLCGARIGCIATHNKEVYDAVTKYAQARLCPPVFGQVATLGALQAPGDYFERSKKEYIARRDFTIDALNKMDGVYSPKPDGAFYTVAELPVDDADDFAKWLLTDFRIDNETVMITPAASFYRNPVRCRNQVRIAYVLAVEDLRKAMHIIEEGLKAYNNR